MSLKNMKGDSTQPIKTTLIEEAQEFLQQKRSSKVVDLDTRVYLIGCALTALIPGNRNSSDYIIREAIAWADNTMEKL